MTAKSQEVRYSMLEVALAQLDAVAARLKLDPGIHKRLRKPQRSLVVSVPTLMDDGRLEVFTGFRVQHDLTLGPTKGGIRYHPGVDLEEVTALALMMAGKFIHHHAAVLAVSDLRHARRHAFTGKRTRMLSLGFVERLHVSDE